MLRHADNVEVSVIVNTRPIAVWITQSLLYQPELIYFVHGAAIDPGHHWLSCGVWGRRLTKSPLYVGPHSQQCDHVSLSQFLAWSSLEYNLSTWIDNLISPSFMIKLLIHTLYAMQVHPIPVRKKRPVSVASKFLCSWITRYLYEANTCMQHCYAKPVAWNV